MEPCAFWPLSRIMEVVSSKGDVLQLEKETLITVMKPKMVSVLSDLIAHEGDRQDFLLLCARVDATIRAWYHQEFEEMMQLYTLFDPVQGKKVLEQQNLDAVAVDRLEQRFVQLAFDVLKKSDFQILSDTEYEIATSGQYMLDLPIEVDQSKLDKKLISKYFSEHVSGGVPKYSTQYVIFRRGVGVDSFEGLFINEKMDMLLGRLWKQLLVLLRIEKPTPPAAKPKSVSICKKLDVSEPDVQPEEVQRIERSNIQSMELKPENILGNIKLQEPTFSKIIVLYRPATPPGPFSELGDRSIYIKQFDNIPMADMEIVLPEKKNPSLTPMDWVRFLMTGFTGLTALYGTLQKEISAAFAYTLLMACVGFLSKVYFTWQASIGKYRTAITLALYGKQLDSGRGTLLHLTSDVIDQEVKEIILGYFVLMTQGRSTKKELDKKCEELMQEEFKESVEFDVDEAMAKLLKFGIINRDAAGALTHQPLKRANEIIGVTTDEVVARYQN